MADNPKIYREMHLYFFTCEKCGVVNRCSFKRARANNKLCRNCRKFTVDKNQEPLFPDVMIKAGNTIIKRLTHHR